MPHISIITTTYNHSDYIAHTIESVLSQTFDNWTMYIGDDSPDTRTWDIIATYVEKYPDKIKAYRNIPSLGIVGNMNRLLEHAVHSTYLTTNPSPSEKGTPSPIGEDRDEEYISFLEGDDMYTPDNLQKKIDILESYPDVGLIYSDWHRMDAAGIVHARTTSVSAGVQTYTLVDFLKSGNPIQSWGVVCMRANVLQKILPLCTPTGETTGMYGPLDYATWVRIVPYISVYYIADPIFLYRVHAANYTRNVSAMNIQLEQIYTNILENTTDREVQNVCRFFIYNNAMMSAFASHSTYDVWRNGIYSFRYDMYTIWYIRITIMCISILPWYMVDRIQSMYKK